MEAFPAKPTRRRFLLALGAPLLASIAASPLAAADRVHIVRKGDTLSELAQRYGVTVRELKRRNGLSSDLIKIGQRLRIPGDTVDVESVARLLRGTRIQRERWNYIVAHHSATKYGNAEIYDNYHRRRGMQNGLAYHFVIGNGLDSGDGEIEIGPRWRRQLHGGHVRKWKVNREGIGICLVGNFEKTRPTPRQLEAFTALTQYLGVNVLKNRYKFMVHKEVDPGHTICPGRNFPVRAMHRRFG